MNDNVCDHSLTHPQFSIVERVPEPKSSLDPDGFLKSKHCSSYISQLMYSGLPFRIGIAFSRVYIF